MSSQQTPPTTREELRRLTLVRYLYDLGADQSRGPEPVASFAVLALHDGVEAMLVLAAERHSVPESRDFMAYWKAFAAKNILVPEERAIGRLTAARNALKHKGVLPSHQELEGFRSAVTNFMFDGATVFFGVNFEDLSLARLVENTKIRDMIEKGLIELKAGELTAALGSAAVAFRMVQDAHNEKLKSSVRPYRFKPLRELAHSGRIRAVKFPVSSLNLQASVGEVIDSIENNAERTVQVFSEAIEAIGYGLNLAEFQVFKASCPFVITTASGTMSPGQLDYTPNDPNNVDRCLKFVVDAAIRLNV